MERILITIGSVTTASRFKKLIESRLGIRSEIIHTPSALNCGSCSYSLRCSGAEAEEISALAKEIGLKFKGIYREELNIRGEKQYNAVS